MRQFIKYLVFFQFQLLLCMQCNISPRLISLGIHICYIYSLSLYIYLKTSGSCRPFNEKVDKILHSLPNFISGPFCNFSPRHVYIYGVSTSSPTPSNDTVQEICYHAHFNLGPVHNVSIRQIYIFQISTSSLTHLDPLLRQFTYS